MSDSAEHNPFATRFTRPGAIEYLFPAGNSPDALLARLEQNGWWGEIVGPHGAGKSTLLATLVPYLAAVGRNVEHVTLHAGQRSLPSGLNDWRSWTSRTQVIVDGYEQLSWWSRHKLSRRVKNRQAGLLVTSHAPTGLPTILQVTPHPNQAEQVVRRLLPDANLISAADIDAAYRASDGNLREMLFALYDVYEARDRRQT